MRPSLLALASCLVPLVASNGAADARGSVTTWEGGQGDWSAGANWTNGEPTASDVAEIPFGTVLVTEDGELCHDLLVSPPGGSAPTLRIQSGSLTVTDLFHAGVASVASIQQNGGVITAGRLKIGDLSGGGVFFLQNNAALTVGGDAEVGGAGGLSSNFSVAGVNAIATIQGSLYIAHESNVVVGGGALHVGTQPTDDVSIDGAFQILNMADIQLTRFTMSSEAQFNVLVGPVGVSTIFVSGPAVLDGSLNVSEAAVNDGDYEVLRANPLSGTFDTVTFFGTDWSWRIEGNSVFVKKGTNNPVEETHWSTIKELFRP